MKLGNYLCISALVLTVLTLSSCGKKHNEEIDGFAAPGTENDRVTVTLYGIQPLPHFEEAVEKVSKKQRILKLTPVMLEKVREVMEDNQ